MKFYIIAGEASGDLHGANLIKAISNQHPDAEFRVWGGDKMEAAGAVLVKHYRELAFMGFVEVIANLRTILSNLKLCKEDILAYKPDALIFIDYPGFNLRLAPFAKKHGIRSFYYILPQIWAWKKSRVKILERNVESLYSILPFEEKFYKDYDVDFNFVGHPLLDEIQDFKAKATSDASKPVLLLLPGSRMQELKKILPIMLKTASKKSKYDVIVGKASSLDAKVYEELMTDYPNIKLSDEGTYSLLSRSSLALVTSGTATLETALFKVPQVVCYRGSFISIEIAKRIVDIPYISLVNLIANKELVKELIQEDLNETNILTEIEKLESEEGRRRISEEYTKLIELLGKSGASDLTAKLLLKTLSS